MKVPLTLLSLVEYLLVSRADELPLSYSVCVCD